MSLIGDAKIATIIWDNHMPIYQVTGVTTQGVRRTYDAPNAEAAKVGDGELLGEEVLDEMDFDIEAVEEIEP